MRSLRLPAVLLAAGLAAAAATPASTAMAQGAAVWDVRPNSWYWGLYGGQTSFATTIARTYAPMWGAEWMITRTRYALNVFAEQSYFNAVTTVPDSGGSSAPRRVDIQDMRRVGASGMIFLPQYKYFHPWFGAGYAFNMIRTATPQGSSYTGGGPHKDAVAAAIENRRSEGKVFGEFGMMFSYRQWAPFVQYTVMPTKGDGKFMVNGEGFTNIWKLGWRYSFGSAFEERW